MNKYVFIIGFLLLNSSCKSPDQHFDFLIQNSKEIEVVLDDIFEDVKVVELKTFINSVNDILLWKERWVVVDKNAESLLVFNYQGDLLKRINGDVLSNYQPIQPVSIQENNAGNLILYEVGGQKIIEFGEDLEVVSKKDAEFYMHRIYKEGDNYLVYKNQTQQNKEHDNFMFNLILCDLDFNVIKKFEPFSVEIDVPRSWMFFEDPIYFKDNRIEYYEPFNNKVKVFSSDLDVDSLSYLNFGFLKRNFDRNLLEINFNNPQEVMEDFFPHYSMLIGRRLENSEFNIVRYADDFSQKINVFKSGSNEWLYSANILKIKNGKNYEAITFPSYVLNDRFISVLDEDNISQMSSGNSSYFGLENPFAKGLRDGKTYIVSIK